MTFQPKKRSRAKVHGFRARMSTAGGRKVLAARRAKEEKDYQRRPHICGLFSIQNEEKADNLRTVEHIRSIRQCSFQNH